MTWTAVLYFLSFLTFCQGAYTLYKGRDRLTINWGLFVLTADVIVRIMGITGVPGMPWPRKSLPPPSWSF
jgi:hypothetical protein